MKTVCITTSINDGEYDEHTYVEGAQSVEQVQNENSVIVNGSVKITFSSPIVRIGPE